MQRREVELEDQVRARDREIERLRVECDARLAKAADDKEKALARLVTELTGQADEIAAMREAEAKEARVDEMRAKASKRLFHRGLARGFEAWQASRPHVLLAKTRTPSYFHHPSYFLRRCGAWQAVYNEQRYAMARLQACSNRLRTPALAAAWSFWAKDMAEAQRKAEWDALVAQTQSVEAQLRQARYETKQLGIIRVAQDDENRLLREQVRCARGSARPYTLSVRSWMHMCTCVNTACAPINALRILPNAAPSREQVSMLTGKQTEQSEALASYTDLPSEIERLKAALADSESTAKEAVEKRIQAEADVLSQLDQSKALLERLLEEQKQRLVEHEKIKLAEYERAASKATAELAKVCASRPGSSHPSPL